MKPHFEATFTEDMAHKFPEISGDVKRLHLDSEMAKSRKRTRGSEPNGR
jgi:acyl dehydratase